MLLIAVETDAPGKLASLDAVALVFLLFMFPHLLLCLLLVMMIYLLLQLYTTVDTDALITLLL